jgi:hypothetical protein
MVASIPFILLREKAKQKEQELRQQCDQGTVQA